MSFNNHKRVQSNRSNQRRRAVNPARTLSLMTRKVGGPNDPPAIPKSLRTFFKVELAVPAGTVSPFNVAMSTLAVLIPGNTSNGNWSKMRLEKVSAWDVLAQDLEITFAADLMSFTDVGVVGSRASALHLQPPLVLKSTWVTPNSSASLFTITPGANNSRVIVHATLELVR